MIRQIAIVSPGRKFSAWQMILCVDVGGGATEICSEMVTPSSLKVSSSSTRSLLTVLIVNKLDFFITLCALLDMCSASTLLI